MQVHDARHQGQTLGIDGFLRRTFNHADVGDVTLRDGHIGPLRGAAQAVVNLCIADDQVMHLSNTLLLCESKAGNMPCVLDYRQLPAGTCRAFDIRVFQTYLLGLGLAVQVPQVAQAGYL